MSLTPDSKVELRGLCDHLIDETISEQEIARLNELLGSSEEALDFYIQYLWMNEGILRRFGNEEASWLDASQFQNAAQAQEQNAAQNAALSEGIMSESVATGHQANLGRRLELNRWRNQSRYWVAAAICLVIAGVALVAAWTGDPSSVPQVAESPTLIESDPTREKMVQEVRKNQLETESSESKTDGVIRENSVEKRTLDDGSILIAKRGSRYELQADRRLNLLAGDIYLIVAKSDRPFMVHTPEGRVEATGTRFAVSTGPNDLNQTTASVSQGTVILTNQQGNVELGAGQQGTIVEGERPIRGPAPRLSHIVNWAKQALKQQEPIVDQVEKENGLIAKDPYGQQTRLSLRKYNVDVYIEDGMARTTIDQTFFNHNPWNTEGTFYFPLPPNASVSRLAMYVNGKLNEGGMVSRARGQEIYTDILYQRRDPALLEMMEGNTFKMRIFPLEGRQEKRILLSYTQPLSKLYGTERYWFPMDHTNDTAGEITIHVRVKDGAAQFESESSTHVMETRLDGNDLVLDFEATKIAPDQDFLLSLIPQQKVSTGVETSYKSGPISIADSSSAVCAHEGNNYLFTRITPQVHTETIPQSRSWVVLNDISSSRTEIEQKTQLHILQRLLDEADDADTVFRIDLNTAPHLISKRPVNVRSDEAVRDIKFEPARLIGATDMASGLASAAKVIRDHQLVNPHVVYLGDGVATDGETSVAELPDVIPDSATFVGIGVGKRVDSLFLQEAADRTGGMFVTIHPDEDVNWRVFDLISALNTPRLMKVNVQLLDEDDQPVSSISYLNRRNLSAGEELSVVALCDNEAPTRIELTGRLNDQRIKKVIDIRDVKKEAEFIPRLWAKRHIDELLKSDMSRKEEIVTLSKNYYVVTPFTSLIVLEDDAMYQEYNVERGRKDHWALYPAPSDIEVVKEPIDWNRWGWYGNFEGDDAKVEAKTDPRSIQEIVDGIQLRIDAPFYYWPSQPADARAPLYSLCDLKIEDPTALSRMLTLSYLLAIGERNSIIEWSNEVESPRSENRTESQKTDFLVRRKAFQERLVQRHLSVVPSLTYAGRPMSSTLFKAVSPRFRQQRLNGVFFENSVFPKGFGFSNRELSEWVPQPDEIQLWDSRFGIQNRFDDRPQFYQSFGNAVSNRWERINQDIRKFNQQYGYWNGAINDGLNASSWGSDLDTIWIDSGLTNALDVLDFETEALSVLSTRRPVRSIEELISPIDNINLDFGRVPLRRSSSLSLFSRSELVGSGGGRGFLSRQADFFDSRPSRQPIELATQDFFAIIDRPTMIRPLTFFAISQSPLRLQPGTASVLAADLLSKRLSELESQTAASNDQNAELAATRAAISAVEKVGSTLESKKFWGGNGWNFQPRPANLQPPVMQTYHGYDWSFELTRYATGLSSDTTDMLNEVISQFGSGIRSGKVSAEANRLIVDSRANFRPMTLSVTEEGPLLAIGPNDQFAMRQSNEMSLEEQVLVDGAFYIQAYEELGLAARRPASEIQMSQLRAITPFLLPPARHLQQGFDVDLISQSTDSFRLRLTPVKKPRHSGDSSTEKGTSVTQSDQPSIDSPNLHTSIILVADHAGLIRRKELRVDDQIELVIDIERTETEISIKWQIPTENGETESGESGLEKALQDIASHQMEIQSESPDVKLFEFTENEFVVIDMPLRKPGYYRDQINRLAETGEGKETKNVASLEFAVQDRENAIHLLFHLGLAHLQEYNWRRWGRANPTANEAFNAAFNLKTQLGQPANRGDATLAGSAGFGQLLHSSEHYPKAYFESLRTDPLVRYFVGQRDENVQSSLASSGRGLISHLSSFSIARRNRSSENVDRFNRDFERSPLRLVLASESGFKGLMALANDSDWAGTAFLLAAHQAGDKAQQKKFAEEFWKRQQQMPSLDAIVLSSNQIATTLKAGDPDQFAKFLERKLTELQQSPAIVRLLSFAERVSVWNENDVAERAFELARQKLESADSQTETPLLNRLAIGYAYWAGNRFDAALSQFQKIRKELRDQAIPLSPSLLAAIARLAQQAGDHELAVDLEEQAMIAEIPYLPDLINLNAYRKRYQWLWSQYMSAIQQIKADDPERSKKLNNIVTRASATWDRWRKIDGSNTNLPTMMANLLKSADRSDTECWAYLSTTIDDKPKDATSYFQVAQWYRNQNDLKSAVRFYSEAPQWDTANPRWIYEYGIALKERGDRESANRQFNKIINGKWAAGLQRWVDQAKAAVE